MTIFFYFIILGDFKTAIDYLKRKLKITKEIGDRMAEVYAYNNLGIVHKNMGDLEKAIDYCQCSVTTYNDVRNKLYFNDEWKISFRDMHDAVYRRLWLFFLMQGKVVDALV